MFVNINLIDLEIIYTCFNVLLKLVCLCYLKASKLKITVFTRLRSNILNIIMKNIYDFLNIRIDN